jgi:hypothetical protein
VLTNRLGASKITSLRSSQSATSVLSLDLIEGRETFSYKHDTIHARFKKR